MEYSKNPGLADHLAWLGYVQPEGLVVSAPALVDAQVIIDKAQLGELQRRFVDYVDDVSLGEGDTAETAPGVPDVARLFLEFLGWDADLLVGWDGAHPLPEDVAVSLPEFQETLRPTFAVRDPNPSEGQSSWLLLVQTHPATVDLDKPISTHERGWHAAPAKKFERLLRELKVPIGILTSGTQFRLVYAPPKENSGAITFPVGAMTEVSGRLILGAFHLLLNSWTLFTAPSEARLPKLLQHSRDYQASVSEVLAEQVLHALYELLRGFEAADERSQTGSLRQLATNRPEEIYGGLVTVLLRLVFVLFAEDRGLLPTDGTYVRYYAVRGLFERLRADAERYPDTMDHRFGAWPQLLTLFRMIHGGCQYPGMKMPARAGHLFDPDRYPFLEGRASKAEQIAALPLVSDGTVHRILENLCILEGERVSYRTLDVEEIGSVYQTIMGFAVECAGGTAIALKGKRKNGGVPASPVINLDQLLAASAKDRAKWLKENADTELSGEADKRLKAAVTVDDLLVALEKRVDRYATPALVVKGRLVLQPTDERRRSGSHYTPRSFTEPIVRNTLAPILNRFGEQPTANQILNIKICDLAVGSAAFLVETCRQLADVLVRAWRLYGGRPVLPPDETEELFAMRIIAQRCLYGVDRNPMAVDLAKLSLWLATLAKDHPFTFLDHSIRSGDSLVGLTTKQLAAFTWGATAGVQRMLGQDRLEKRIAAATAYREDILEAGDFLLPSLKAQKLVLADEALDEIRFVGDLAVAAFFGAERDKARQQLREDLLERYSGTETNVLGRVELKKVVASLHNGYPPLKPFHWEIEFPEVFGRERPGFDALVGNPPFQGGSKISTAMGKTYMAWLAGAYPDSHGKSDLVAYFFRRGYTLARKGGTTGLIATKTIRQGETRSTGLTWIRKNGGRIYMADLRRRWPGAAAVIVSVIHIIKDPETTLQPILNGRAVDVITAYLFHFGPDSTPATLDANRELVYSGVNINGEGFVLSPEEREHLLRLDPSSAERIRPYLGAKEMNGSPSATHSRYVINMEGLGEDDVKRWPHLYERLYSTVRIQRSGSSEERLKQRWWLYSRPARDLYQSASRFNRLLASGRHGFYISFAFQPTSTVFSDALTLFLFDKFAGFAVMQSRIHECWALFFNSSIKDDSRYIPEDCFETFPFPRDFERNAALEEAGQRYYEFRSEVMRRRGIGLTELYSIFHNPGPATDEIITLRRLHEAMDVAVLAAYGWRDIELSYEFILDFDGDDEEFEAEASDGKKPWRFRWPDGLRDDVLARLLKLNAERSEEERCEGEAPKLQAAKPAEKKSSAGAKRRRNDKTTAGARVTPPRHLPTDLRLAETAPELYAVGLVIALLSEAGGSLLASRLIDAFALATQPEQMKRLAPPELERAANDWAKVWNEGATPHDLLPALNNLTSANIAVERTTLGIEFALQDGPNSKLPPHLAYDAWLGLRVAETLQPSTVLVSGADREALLAKLESLVA